MKFKQTYNDTIVISQYITIGKEKYITAHTYIHTEIYTRVNADTEVHINLKGHPIDRM